MTTKLIDKMKKVVQEKVNPVLKMHNGSCQIVSYDDDSGTLIVRLLGGCVGCPASKMTLMNGVVPILEESFPGKISGVYLDLGSDDEKHSSNPN